MDTSTELTESESNLQLHLDTSHDENDVSLTNDPELEPTLANIEKGISSSPKQETEFNEADHENDLDTSHDENDVSLTNNPELKPTQANIKKGTSLEQETESCEADPENRDSADGEENQDNKVDDIDSDEDQNHDSSEEELDRPIKKKLDVKTKKRKRSNDSIEDSSSSDKGEEERRKTKKSKSEKQSGQKSTQESSKILKLKKYLAVAGIRIQNYAKVFEGCKSKKAKEAKLLEMLEEQGLKGKPTLEKCKKMRKKIEAKKEVAELDLCNIIDYNGSSRGKTTRTTRNRLKPIDTNKQDIKDPFGNLYGIIDSEEESDTCKKEEINAGKRKIRVIESEDESFREEIENEAY
ncbi:HIRA-interacting protein 3-like [Rhopilema esculentum]|uniref:HIRA-interacting protein 3-like n=1 Tax=Rhopilema esculentum TaxID=499914 RepID=UPI0031D98EFA|eukprot:gene691-10399_t